MVDGEMNMIMDLQMVENEMSSPSFSTSSMVNCVLNALAILYQNKITSKYYNASGHLLIMTKEDMKCITHNCNIIGRMWKRFSSKTYLIESFREEMNSNNYDNIDGNLLAYDRFHRPLYTAIRRKFSWRSIVRDIVKLDPSALYSVDNIERLPMFALAAAATSGTSSCSQSLESPIFLHDDECTKEITATERVYELLRANPIVLFKMIQDNKVQQPTGTNYLQVTKHTVSSLEEEEEEGKKEEQIVSSATAIDPITPNNNINNNNNNNNPTYSNVSELSSSGSLLLPNGKRTRLK